MNCSEITTAHNGYFTRIITHRDFIY